MERQTYQLYNENMLISYPLDDSVGDAVPLSLLVDMGLSMPEAMLSADVRVTNIVVTAAYAFMSLETVTGLPVAHVNVIAPEPFRAYRMTCAAGCLGWVVFGTAASTPFNAVGCAHPVDARCLIPVKAIAAPLTLMVDGVPYAMPEVLHVVAQNYVSAAAESREVESPYGTVDALVLRRNDAAISEDTLKNGLTKYSPLPLYTINGVGPDAAGNIDIKYDTIDDRLRMAAIYDTRAVPPGPVALVLYTRDVTGCDASPAPLKKNIKYSSCGHGVPYELPLDKMADLFNQANPCGD